MLFPKLIFVLLGTGLIAAQGAFHQTSFENPHATSDCKINLGGGTKPFGARDLLDGVMEVVQLVPVVGSEISTAYSIGSKIYDFLDGVISPKKDKIVDIWDCIRADVEALVDEKIADEAFEEATEKLAGITNSLELYRDTFYHWTHNTTDPCLQELPGEYGIGDQAMALYSILQAYVPQFGSIAQQKPLLPYYIFVATLHFSIAADIWVYGDKWEIDSDMISSVRDVSLERLNTYSAHAMDVLDDKYIGACVTAGYDACSALYREIMDGSVRLVPTWPVLASFGTFSRSGAVIHNSHHMMSSGPEATWGGYAAWLQKEMIRELLFDESRIYEQTICTSPDDILFGWNDYLTWDGGYGGNDMKVLSPGNLHWTFGKDLNLCSGSYLYNLAPQCEYCHRVGYDIDQRQPGQQGRLDKRVGGGILEYSSGSYRVLKPDGSGYTEFSYPVMDGLDCSGAQSCNLTMIKSSWVREVAFDFTLSNYTVPDNYHIYNIHPTCPSIDMAELMQSWGSSIVLEYAPVQKTFDSLVVNGTTHVIPGASPNMEWATNTVVKRAGFNEYLFGGHAAYSIDDGSSYYNINTPPGEPVQNLTVGAFILDETASYWAKITHESGTLNIQLDKTNTITTGVQGQYNLYVSGVNSIPSAIKTIAITGTRGSLLGAIILSNDIGST